MKPSNFDTDEKIYYDVIDRITATIIADESILCPQNHFEAYHI